MDLIQQLAAQQRARMGTAKDPNLPAEPNPHDLEANSPHGNHAPSLSLDGHPVKPTHAPNPLAPSLPRKPMALTLGKSKAPVVPVKKIGLTLGVAPVKQVTTVSPPYTPEPASLPEPAPTNNPLKLGGALGALLKTAAAPKRSIYSGGTDLSPTAEMITANGDYFELDMLMSQWPPAEDDDEGNTEENQLIRNKHIAAGVSRLNHIFATQLDTLRVADAAHPIMAEIGRIVKLTFMRVQNSPAAWRILADPDRSTVIRALQIMGDKRGVSQSAIKAGKKANSQLLEDATNPAMLVNDEINEALAMLDGMGGDDIFGGAM